MIRLRASSAPITCAWPSMQRSGEAGTPTQSPPSQAGCLALSMGRQRFLRSGVACCMAGQGWHTRDLVALATRIVKEDKPFSYDTDRMTPVQHPHDDGVWLGDVAALQGLPPGVDAVVSLCRVNDDDLPAGVEQIDIRLIDKVEPAANPNLDFVLTDTVRLIEQLRNEGRTVLLHCVACQSRTPTVAALYGARRQGISGEAALREVTSVFRTPTPTATSVEPCRDWHHDLFTNVTRGRTGPPQGQRHRWPPRSMTPST